MNDHGTQWKRRPIKVITPDEPPKLTSAAARALLAILCDASEDVVCVEERAEQRKPFAVTAGRGRLRAEEVVW